MKLYFLLIGLFTVLWFNISCKNNNETSIPKDSITILYPGDERIFHQDYWGMEATFWIFLPLVAYEGGERGELQPVLAESWTHSEDYREWTVHLRKDIYWHDGVQMTANDIKFSLDLKKKAFGGYSMGIKFDLIDDFTFKLIGEKPIPKLPFWEVYYPKHLLDTLDPDEYFNWDFWKHPIGNGPYRFVRSEAKTMVEVEANPNYFRTQPKIKKAILKFSDQASLPELLSGNVDVITDVPRDFLFKIDGDKRFQSYYWWGVWIQTINWNHNNKLFSDAKVRKALTMAVNRNELAQVLNYPKNIPIADVLYTKKQRATLDFPTPVAYDPEGAIQLLIECGWNDANQDHILEKNGLNFSFTIIVEKANALMATYIQENFRRIGVHMKVETTEWNIVKQRLENNDFEAIIGSLPSHDIYGLKNLLGKDSFIGYNNREIDSLLTAIQLTGNPEKIDELYKKMMPILQNELPLTFIFPQVLTHIAHKRIKGMNNHYNSDPVWFLEFLWIE